MTRSILHCDMNNFYASVECLRDPGLRGRPIAVCGETEERHGIVLAKSYEAKAFGIITGETVWQARRKCPGLVVVPPHYVEYVRISAMARAIYERYTDCVEPMGLDECWLDVTGSRRLFGTGEAMAHAIREAVKTELGVTISVGVSFNKVFAKLGSDMKKPDAVTVLASDTFREQVWPLPVSELLGVGRATARHLHPLGIHTIGDLAHYPSEYLRRKLGKCGEDIWRFANGLDTSAVVPRGPDDPDKTVGHGITTLQDLVTDDEVWPVMLELAQNVGHRLHLYEQRALGVAIAIRDNAMDYRQWQCRLSHPTQRAFDIAEAAFSLFRQSYPWVRPIRSVTVRAMDLVAADAPYQLDLFTDSALIRRREALDNTVEALRTRYGSHIIRNAVLLHNPKMPTHDVIGRNAGR